MGPGKIGQSPGWGEESNAAPREVLVLGHPSLWVHRPNRAWVSKPYAGSRYTLRAMKTPRAILVDLDDTLLDSTASATRGWRTTAEAFAGEIGQKSDAIDKALLDARAWFWADPVRHAEGRLDLFKARADIVDRAFQSLGVADYELARRFAQTYTRQRISSMRLFPGALDTLEYWCSQDIKLALITNGKAETQRAKVQRFGLAPYFEGVFIEGEIGFGKPDLRVYEAALNACGLSLADAAQAWCVGDHLEWEVKTPQTLGMRGVWVDWEGIGVEAKLKAEKHNGTTIRPDRVVQTIRELAQS